MSTLDGLSLGDLIVNHSERGASTDLAGATDYTLGGREVVWLAPRRARPITLEGGEDVWLDAATVQALRAMAATPHARHILALPGGETVTVRWRHESAPVLEAMPVMAWSDAQPMLYNNIRLRFAEAT